MKNVLVLIHDDAGQEARLQAALDVTRALDGHLTCLDVVQMPVIAGDYFSASGYAVMLEDSEAREDKNRARLQQRLAHEDVAWDMSRSSGDIADCIDASTALADIVVVNTRLEDVTGPQMLGIVSMIVLQSHRPVMAVPQDWKRLDTAGTVLVAWDGSLPAMAALSGAIPLLKAAGTVRLVHAGDKPCMESLEEAAIYLSRHGIHPEIEELAGNDGRPDDLIVAEARKRKAAYVVMGAYGHSHLREAMFGGVTHRMLERAEIPLFLAH